MPPIRIAVIGSGIAGLSAAYWFSQETDIAVTLLEKQARVGMDAYRLDLSAGDSMCSVDVPSRMFNTSQWPRLTQLYDQLGIAYESVDATQSFTRFSQPEQVTGETFLKLDVALRPEQALRQFVRTESRRLLAEASKLMTEGRNDLKTGLDRSQTLREYLLEKRYTTSFRENFLYPTLSSTVCTCSFAGLDDYPAWIVLSALRRLTDDRHLMRTRHGTKDVVSRLLSPSIKVRTNFIVSNIVGNDHGVKAHWY